MKLFINNIARSCAFLFQLSNVSQVDLGSNKSDGTFFTLLGIARLKIGMLCVSTSLISLPKLYLPSNDIYIHSIQELLTKTTSKNIIYKGMIFHILQNSPQLWKLTFENHEFLIYNITQIS